MRIRFDFGSLTLDAELLDTPTAKAVAAALPITSSAMTWGEEVYFEVPVKAAAERHADSEFYLYLGRHVGLPVALEGALKLKEISYIPTDAYAAGEMKHGPIALIDDGLPVVCIAVRDAVYEKMISNIEQVKARGGHVIAVVTEGDRLVRDKADHVIEVPETLPLLTPLLASIPMQLLAYHIAVRRGADVDQPRNLAKSVTVE